MYSLIAPAERDRSHSRFSILELLIVVVALAVLAAILLPRLMDSSTRTKELDLRADLQMLRDAVDAFQADTGDYPATLADLAETDVTKVRVSGDAAVNTADWHGPYLQSVPKDPVGGGAYRYVDSTGEVSSSTSGLSLNGTEYSSW